MGIAIKLLERLGFVRLRDFGLVITPERRVLSMRSSVLDDGSGGIVVGWVDSDLAGVELAAWGTKPSQSFVKPRPIPPPPIPQPTTPALVAQVAKPVALALQPTQLAPTAQPVPAQLEQHEETRAASDVDMSDDEWEWEIAMARVRATSAVAPPVVAPPTPKSGPHTIARPTQVHATQAPDDDMVTTVGPMQITERPSSTAESPPRTIIPVPRLPAAVDARLVRQFDEVTRQVPTPSRFPRATMQRAAAANDDETAQTVVVPTRTFANRSARR